jgi:hypothetical protein
MVRKLVFAEDLESKFGIKGNRTSLHRWEKQGRFPRHFIFGNRRCWYEDTIVDFVNSVGVTDSEAGVA